MTYYACGISTKSTLVQLNFGHSKLLLASKLNTFATNSAIVRGLNNFTQIDYLRVCEKMCSGIGPIEKFFDAVKKNDLETVEDILEAKTISPNIKDPKENNSTALHIAAYKDYYKLAQLLVDKYGADVNAVDDLGEIPLQVAKDNYNANICKFLVEKNSKRADYAQGILNTKEVDDLFEAAEANNIEKVSHMIDANVVDVNSEDKGGYGATILHVAAKKGFEDLARILVDKYKANVNHMDEIGDRPIHVAAQNDHIGIVKFLTERNSKDIEDVKDYLK